MRSATSEVPTRDVPPLGELFPFPLDDFQLEAIDALNQGQSVVVSAPTGSGKTLVGEYAIHRALAHGQKVFYTTPLKALSNQKLRDFREQFGVENVGLMTGDFSVNREASIVVMTTEIFRNMLYAEVERGDDPLADVEAVVLDLPVMCYLAQEMAQATEPQVVRVAQAWWWFVTWERQPVRGERLRQEQAQQRAIPCKPSQPRAATH